MFSQRRVDLYKGFGLAVTLLLLTAEPVWAQAPGRGAAEPAGAPGTEAANDAKMLELTAQGVALFKEGRYEEAIERFEQAHALVDDANLLFNIGRSHEKLGHIEEAVAFYQRFISSPGILAGDRERAAKRIENLRLLQMSPPKPGTVPGTAVPKPKRSHTVAWSLIGSGAAVAVAGSVFGGLALKSEDDLHGSASIQKKQDLQQQVRGFAIAADACIGIGAAALITGVILYFVLDEGPAGGTGHVSVSSPVIPFAMPHGAGAAFGVRF